MPKFQIDLEETIRHRTDIEAPTEEAALALARQWEEDGELEDNVDFVEVDSSPLRVSADVVDRYTPFEVILGNPRMSRTFQVTATVSRSKGSISYVMQTVPEGNYTQALSNLQMRSTTPLPRTIREGWQKQAIEVLGSGLWDVQQVWL